MIVPVHSKPLKKFLGFAWACGKCLVDGVHGTVVPWSYPSGLKWQTRTTLHSQRKSWEHVNHPAHRFSSVWPSLLYRQNKMLSFIAELKRRRKSITMLLLRPNLIQTVHFQIFVQAVPMGNNNFSSMNPDSCRCQCHQTSEGWRSNWLNSTIMMSSETENNLMLL